MSFTTEPRRRLFWPSEIRVRTVLENIYDRVYAKVTLRDLVDPTFKNTTNNYLFTKPERDFIFNSAHADFVIVDSDDYPILVVEVDGKSHDKLVQKKRDALKDSILSKANIPLVRLKLGFLDRAQIQDNKLKAYSSLALTNSPIQTLVIGALSNMARDSLLLEFAKALYRHLKTKTPNVDLWQWSHFILRASSIREFEKNWPDETNNHDSVEALFNLLINNEEETSYNSLISDFEHSGHADWIARAYALDQMYLMMTDRHIRRYVEAGASLGGDIAAWYLISESVYYPERQYLVGYIALVQQLLIDFKDVLLELIVNADKNIETGTQISEWLKAKAQAYIYDFPWGGQVSMYSFYGFDRPGGGGITILYDYITDHDKYKHFEEPELSSDDEYMRAMISFQMGWLPEMQTIQDACQLVIKIIDETNIAFNFFIDMYNRTETQLIL